MSGRYLLDTNIIIGLLSGETSVLESIGAAGEVLLPAIAIGELYFGAAKSGRPEANRMLVDRLTQAHPVLSCDVGVASQYGRLKGELKSKGTPLPENDIWIGAMALHHGLTLVSRDRHFREIEGLQLTSW